MKDDRTPTKGEQKRIDVCENVVKWTSENKEKRGCIVLATDEKSSTCAVVGQNQNLITALLSAIKKTPNLRNILAATLMLDMATGGSKNDTGEDK
jgi:hypothetical protein|nr:MAG TPA: hypothetical protein [Crassvirales sp.]